MSSKPEDLIPYGHQTITDADIESVINVLKSNWLTTGPAITRFEEKLAAFTQSSDAVALNSGTAALHAMLNALNIGEGDEVIIPTMTFVATANVVVWQGATPVLCDVDSDTLLVTPETIEPHITSRTKAIIAVDYAGQPCDYPALHALSEKHGIALLSDACHSLGSIDANGKKVGSLALMTAFSFHPVKSITTAEGGAITTNDPELSKRIRQFRNHGIDLDARQRETSKTWRYQMTQLGLNYRMSDIHAALGVSQLSQLPEFLKKRQRIADKYRQNLSSEKNIQLLKVRNHITHANHLFPIRVPQRDAMYGWLRSQNIGVNVHYMPVHLHPYYQRMFNYRTDMFPAAETAFNELISLPIFPDLQHDAVSYIIERIIHYSVKQ